MSIDFSPIIDVVDHSTLIQAVLAYFGVFAALLVAYEGGMFLVEAITSAYYRAKYGHLLDDE